MASFADASTRKWDLGALELSRGNPNEPSNVGVLPTFRNEFTDKIRNLQSSASDPNPAIPLSHGAVAHHGRKGRSFPETNIHIIRFRERW